MGPTDYQTTNGDILPGVVTPDGQIRLLGALPPKPHGLTSWKDGNNPVIPRAQWKPFSRPRPGVPILDQGQHGSCVGHGSTTALMMSRASAGMTFKLLSPCFLYGLINGGRDQGANISDAMAALLKTGTCLESEVPEGDIYASRFPKSAYASAANYKALDCYGLQDFDDVGSALQLGWDVSFSVCVGNRFMRVDSDGIAGVDPGYGNHCVYAGEEMILINGVWYCGGRNSWGLTYGNKGRFRWGERHISTESAFDAFAVRTATSAPDDATNPPIAI